MMEMVLAVALLWAAWRLRRSARLPQRVDIHHHIHVTFDSDPGEPAAEDQEGAASNVVPFRRVRR